MSSSSARASTLLLWILLVSAAGCVPWVPTFYRPDAPGARLSGARCHGGSGPNEVATFDHAGIKVEVEAHDKSAMTDGRTHVLATFLIPEGVTFKLSSNEFELVFDDERLRVAVDQLYLAEYRAGGRKVRADTDVTGTTVRRGVMRFYTRYGADLVTTRSLGPRFTLLLPAAVINDVATRFPSVQFIETTELAFYALNC